MNLLSLSLLSSLALSYWWWCFCCLPLGWTAQTMAFAPPPPPHTTMVRHRPTFLSASRDNHDNTNNNENNDKFDWNQLQMRIAEINAGAGDASLWPDQEPAAVRNDATVEPQHKDDPNNNNNNDAGLYYYIILVESGTAQQGVHTIEYPVGSGHNVLMAFDNWSAAHKFAQLLQIQLAQHDHFSSSSSSSSWGYPATRTSNKNNHKKQKNHPPTPQPFRMDLAGLYSFCDQLGITVQFVPAGMDLIPPRQNSETFGHRDPTLRQKQRHLEYLFAMEETEIVEQEGLLLLAESVGVGSWD